MRRRAKKPSNSNTQNSNHDIKEETVERPYKLRAFKDKDLFPLLGILKKIGIKDCKDAFVQESVKFKGLPAEKVGYLVICDVAEIVIDNIQKCEDEIYGLWSDISGIPADEMKEMEFGTLPMMIMDSFSEIKNTSFFKELLKLLS